MAIDPSLITDSRLKVMFPGVISRDEPSAAPTLLMNPRSTTSKMQLPKTENGIVEYLPMEFRPF